MASNGPEKDQSKEIKSILLYYTWEQSKNNSLEKKETSNKEIKLHAISKEFIENWKLKIKYDDLKKEIAKMEKEKKEEKIENIISEYYKKEIKDLDLKSFGEIKNISLLKNLDENKKDEKTYINPVLNEDKMELINKEVFEVFESFKELKMDITIIVDCKLKDGKYIMKNNEDKNINEEGQNVKGKEEINKEEIKDKDKEGNNENKKERELEKNKKIDTQQTYIKKENEKEQIKEENEKQKEEEKKDLEKKEEKKEKIKQEEKENLVRENKEENKELEKEEKKEANTNQLKENKTDDNKGKEEDDKNKENKEETKGDKGNENKEGKKEEKKDELNEEKTDDKKKKEDKNEEEKKDCPKEDPKEEPKEEKKGEQKEGKKDDNPKVEIKDDQKEKKKDGQNEENLKKAQTDNKNKEKKEGQGKYKKEEKKDKEEEINTEEQAKKKGINLDEKEENENEENKAKEDNKKQTNKIIDSQITNIEDINLNEFQNDKIESDIISPQDEDNQQTIFKDIPTNETKIDQMFLGEKRKCSDTGNNDNNNEIIEDKKNEDKTNIISTNKEEDSTKKQEEIKKEEKVENLPKKESSETDTNKNKSKEETNNSKNPEQKESKIENNQINNDKKIEDTNNGNEKDKNKDNENQNIINENEIINDNKNDNIIDTSSEININNNQNNNANQINNSNENNNFNQINNTNQNNNINQINNANQNNNNFDFLAFQMNLQMIMQKYMFEHGYENNFINTYYNISNLNTKNEEEKQIIKYFRTKAENKQPNIFNGVVILNTQIPSLGLQNVGATCYMNSTLQCLIHVKELSELLLSAYYLKYPHGDQKVFENHKLSSEYINILRQVFFPAFYGNTSPCFAPYKFKELVGELNPLFSGIAANDAKDLLQFILERMHSELKMSMQYFTDYDIDQRNELQSKQYFFNSYVYQNNSPLLCFLYGINKIQTKCLQCQTVKYNFQSYSLLYFPLKESKKYAIEVKKEKDKNFDEKNYILTLEDCFMYNEKIDHFTGDNSMYCNICGDLKDADYQSVLFATPPVMAIVLNRGRGNLDFQEKFIFGTELNIENYLYNDEKKGKYYLISMVVHFGESSMSGHFMAYCRMDKDSKWFCYNDAFVSECKEDFDEIIKRGTPYILFYHQEE